MYEMLLFLLLPWGAKIAKFEVFGLSFFVLFHLTQSMVNGLSSMDYVRISELPKINYTCIMNVQMKKAGPLILVVLLGLLLFALRRCRQEPVSQTQPRVSTSKPANSNGEINRDKGFDRRISYLEYSNHAKCRMGCRKITQAEVEEIMQEGNINYKKSDLQNARCPRYAIEGITNDDQKVRIVFAQCNEKTTVVTVIDLDTDWSCACPGDDKKFDNKN